MPVLPIVLPFHIQIPLINVKHARLLVSLAMALQAVLHVLSTTTCILQTMSA